MLFHTWTFALFFAFFYPVYLLFRSGRLRVPWLLTASYVFYAWWNPTYLLLILYSTTVDYLAVIGMSRSRRPAWWLAASVVNNLGLLGYFKYAAFLVETANGLLAGAGGGYQFPVPDVLLPVGISFFVFQSMSYTIDYYRGAVARETNFLRYATFVSVFPQLVAGPIERASHLLPQLQRTPQIRLEDVTDGMSMFVVGLFKKVALADYLSLYVDRVYGYPESHSSSALLLATLAFAWQIYFDFSGYTDMARGIGRMIGLRLMLNFDNPYLATGLGDFWRRWHISLSSWFKDYVYVPLGGSRHGTLATYRNMFLTMLISGLWHGASWTFVAWGAIHAVGRVLTRELEQRRFYRERVPRFVKQVGTFAFVCFAWVFFRAETIQDALGIVRRIVAEAWQDPHCPLVMVGLVASVWLYQFLFESRFRRLLEISAVRVGLVLLMLFYLAVFASSRGQAFIYFQF